MICILHVTHVRKKNKYNYEYITLPCSMCKKSCIILEKTIKNIQKVENIENIENVKIKIKKIYCKKCSKINRKMQLEEMFCFHFFF